MNSSKITGFDIDPNYKLKQIVVTLPSSGWTGSAVPYTQTIAANGVTATNIVIVSPQPTQANITAVTECKVVASE